MFITTVCIHLYISTSIRSLHVGYSKNAIPVGFNVGWYVVFLSMYVISVTPLLT